MADLSRTLRAVSLCHDRTFSRDVNPLAGAAANVRDLTIRAPGLSTAGRSMGHRHMPVDLISNSLRYRKMPAMLRFRYDEKLLDALLSLTEIFRLVSYMEHVPYALLNPAHCAPPAIRDSTTPA